MRGGIMTRTSVLTSKPVSVIDTVILLIKRSLHCTLWALPSNLELLIKSIQKITPALGTDHKGSYLKEILLGHRSISGMKGAHPCRIPCCIVHGNSFTQ